MLSNETEGSFRRCGGQGDVLSGAVGCWLAWGMRYEEEVLRKAESAESVK